MPPQSPDGFTAQHLHPPPIHPRRERHGGGQSGHLCLGFGHGRGHGQERVVSAPCPGDDFCRICRQRSIGCVAFDCSGCADLGGVGHRFLRQLAVCDFQRAVAAVFHASATAQTFGLGLSGGRPELRALHETF